MPSSAHIFSVILVFGNLNLFMKSGSQPENDFNNRFEISFLILREFE